MQTLATTRMSSKGQVVIPEEIRIHLGLETGMQFLVVGKGDVVVLKTIKRPSMERFDALIKKARSQARSYGMRHSDISSAIARARGRK